MCTADSFVDYVRPDMLGRAVCMTAKNLLRRSFNGGGMGIVCHDCSPLARDDARALDTIRVTKLRASRDLLYVLVLPCDGNGGEAGGTVEVVAICGGEFG